MIVLLFINSHLLVFSSVCSLLLHGLFQELCRGPHAIALQQQGLIGCRDGEPAGFLLEHALGDGARVLLESLEEGGTVGDGLKRHLIDVFDDTLDC